MCQVMKKYEPLHLHVSPLPWQRGRGKKKGAEQRHKMTFVWVQPRVCLCCFKRRESCACVGQNICSGSSIQRAVRVLPVHPVIISSQDHSRELQDPLPFDFFFPPSLFSFFLVLSSPATSTAVTHAAERHFEFGCMQNVHIKLHKLLPFFSPPSLSLSSGVASVKSLFLQFFFFFFVCPCVPHTSIPVWLDLKGQLEVWQASLTSEG